MQLYSSQPTVRDHAVFTDYMFHVNRDDTNTPLLIIEVKRLEVSCNIGPTRAFAQMLRELHILADKDLVALFKRFLTHTNGLPPILSLKELLPRLPENTESLDSLLVSFVVRSARNFSKLSSLCLLFTIVYSSYTWI